MLWFDALGYNDRFWTVLLARVGIGICGALIGCLSVFLLTLPIPKQPPFARIWPETFGAFYGLLWGVANWGVVLKWCNRVDAGLSEPVINRDVGFYLFTLQFYDAAYWLLLIVVAISLVAAGLYCFSTYAPRDFRRRMRELGLDADELLDRSRKKQPHRPTAGLPAVYLALGAAGLVLAGGNYLNRFHLLFSKYGAVHGAGWTDVQIRLPGYYITAAATAAVGCWFLAHAVRERRARQPGKPATDVEHAVREIVIPSAGVVVIAGAALVVAPATAQWLWVSPNEITVEKPFIERNIHFTRQAFGLDRTETRQFPVSEQLSRETVDDNQQLLSEVRLWDHRALLATYEQFQEIRLYYEFSDVDIDRYAIDGRYRQAMVSPREIEVGNLPQQSQTFVNRRFKYTHGYGLTLAPVSDFTPQGLPNLLVKDLPPKSASPQLSVDRPQIYYGEHTRQYAVVKTEEAEFDYPSGDQNV